MHLSIDHTFYIHACVTLTNTINHVRSFRPSGMKEEWMTRVVMGVKEREGRIERRMADQVRKEMYSVIIVS